MITCERFRDMLKLGDVGKWSESMRDEFTYHVRQCGDCFGVCLILATRAAIHHPRLIQSIARADVIQAADEARRKAECN